MMRLNDTWRAGLADAGLAAIRLMLGVVFVFHGAQKLFGVFGGSGIEGFAGFLESLGMPLPMLNAYMAGGVEFFGGLLLIAGLGTRLVSVPVTFTMLVAAFMAKDGFDARTGGMEYPLTLAVVTAGIGLIGPGRLSLDHVLLGRLSKKAETVA